jgi:hypothetical protein
MREFFLSLLQSLIRDLVAVGVGTLLLGLAGWALAGIPPALAFGAALALCVGLWLLVRFFLNSGDL